MAAQQAQQATQEAGAANAKAGGGLAGRLAIGGFVGGVIAVECLLAYLLIPTPEKVAALAQKNLEKKLPATLAGEDDSHGGKEAKATVEIDLGEYNITVSQPDASTTLRVDFKLYGTVLEGNDELEIKSLFERNIHRFRDQVLYEIRNAEPADLADPGLALIKRRILEKSNTLFGKAVLRSVVFSQFSYFEQ